jgi:hypothetical protein
LTPTQAFGIRKRILNAEITMVVTGREWSNGAQASEEGSQKMKRTSWAFGALGLAFGLSASAGAAERPLTVSDFTSAQECSLCHSEIGQQWKTSMHSQSATDPVFLQMVSQAARDLGNVGIGACLTCHTPVATVAKQIPMHGPVVLPLALAPVAKEGVTCDFCHTISGTEHFGKDISVGAYRYPHKGTTAVKYGVHPDAKTTNHLATSSAFLQSAEFCGICHKFNHPFSGEKLQDTYEEWKSGPYAKDPKKGGKRCQDCHMPVFAGQGASDAPERKDLHAHVFLGGHSEMVKKVANVTLLAHVKGSGGKTNVNLKALVTNVGSGHFMPTGLPGLREMWVEVKVRNAQGTEVFTQKAPIGIEPLGADGRPTMPWNAVRFGKDTRIGPQATRQSRWDFAFPQQEAGPLEARVSVQYRLISELAAKAAGIEPSPALEIAADRLRVFQDGRVDRVAAD